MRSIVSCKLKQSKSFIDFKITKIYSKHANFKYINLKFLKITLQKLLPNSIKKTINKAWNCLKICNGKKPIKTEI